MENDNLEFLLKTLEEILLAITDEHQPAFTGYQYSDRDHALLEKGQEALKRFGVEIEI